MPILCRVKGCRNKAVKDDYCRECHDIMLYDENRGHEQTSSIEEEEVVNG